jgi:hypothetical protein
VIPTDSNNFSAPSHLESLQGQVRAALLTKKRGEARHLLGQLVSLSGDADAVANLKILVSGVCSEVMAYETVSGSIRERLAGDATPAEIQEELDLRIPYWKAFLRDVPVLQIAKDGLADHDNPIILTKLKTLVDHMKAGRMDEALNLWKDLGEPTGAADGVLVQILQLLGRIRDDIEKKNWPSAWSSLKSLQELKKSANLTAYEPGLGEHFAQRERNLGYEMLLVRAGTCGSGGKIRRTMIEELITAKTEIDARAASDHSLLLFKERVDEVIETLGEDSGELESAGGSSRIGRFWLPLVVVIIAGALIGYWYIGQNGPSTPTDSGDATPHVGMHHPDACGRKLAGDVDFAMPNNNFMLFRKVYLSESPGVDHLKITELDGSESRVRAPFKESNGRNYFLIGKTEVSVGQYSQFMSPDQSIKDEPSLPARLVTADDAEKFCKEYAIWLTTHAKLPESNSGKFGQVRLPSNAEWEFVARGGQPERSQWLERYGAYQTPSITEYEWIAGPESSQGKPRKIALLAGNRLGILDMLGNVSEIAMSDRSDLRKHWMRGGNFTVSESSITPAIKQPMPDLMPNISIPFRQDTLGFRVVISATAEWNDSTN